MQITQNPFKIIVKPNASKNEISYDKERDAYRINIKAKPEQNKANIEIIKFLKKELKKDVRIIKGLKSKEKLIMVID